MLASYQLDPTEHISIKFYLKIKFFIPENAFKNIVCSMLANCLGLEVLMGQVRLRSTFWPSPHLYRRWFMSSIHECDLKRSMCVHNARKVFMPSVTQCWFWNVHHHHLYLRQRWVNVSSTTLRSTPPRSGWHLRKRSAMILIEVSQQAFFSIMSGSYLFNMFVLFCNVNLM